MPNAKPARIHPDQVPRPVVAVGGNVLGGRVEVTAHEHRKAQLMYIVRGVVTCEVSQALWVVAPGSALWVPGGERHSLKGAGPIELYCLFVDEAAAPALPNGCCTLSVSPLLRELLFRSAEIPTLYPVPGPESRLFAVLLDELAAAPVERLHLPMPLNDRLREVVDAMIADPSERAAVNQWAGRIGVSERTLRRLTLRETGMSFVRWRQQLHISLALQWLSQGASVKAVAHDLGYESASSFVFMFRQVLGSSPGRYMAQRLARSTVGDRSRRTVRT